MQRCVECNEVTKNDWVSHETDEGVVCIDCANIPEDDGQPSWNRSGRTSEKSMMMNQTQYRGEVCHIN